jgi:hypothetical protein
MEGEERHFPQPGKFSVELSDAKPRAFGMICGTLNPGL